ncbi:MAG: imelysin family protein [Bacteroidota bacterium]
MKKMSWKFIGILSVAVIALVACSKKTDEVLNDEPAGISKNRQEMLTNLADNIIIPSYARFKTRLDAMVTASEGFAAAPSVSALQDFRSAWVTAYTEWQKVELFDVGPGEKYTIRYFFNIYPASVDGINANIQNPNANLELPSNFPCQGFPALDYLLNGLASTDAEILTYYTTDANAAKRLAYIKRINAHMTDLISKVSAEWNGSFKSSFTGRTGTDISSSTSIWVNALTLHYERYLRSAKFGIPSGAMLNGIVAANKVEAFYKKDISGILAKTAHQAFIDMFNGRHAVTGSEGPSISSYLDALDAKDPSSGVLLSDFINTQLSVCQTQIESLDPNFYNLVQTNNQAMKNTYNELQKTVKYIKVDMTSAMSVTITYTDNDGD